MQFSIGIIVKFNGSYFSIIRLFWNVSRLNVIIWMFHYTLANILGYENILGSIKSISCGRWMGQTRRIPVC